MGKWLFKNRLSIFDLVFAWLVWIALDNLLIVIFFWIILCIISEEGERMFNHDSKP